MTSRLFFLVVCTLVHSEPSVQAQVDAAEELRANALKQWEVLYDRIQSVRWEMRAETSGSRDGKPYVRHTTDIERGALSRAGHKFDNEAEVYDAAGKVTSSRHGISIANEQYAAHLGRPKSGGGWLLGQLKQGAEAEEARTQGRFQTGLPWLVVGNVRLRVWMGDNSFVVTRIEAVPGAEGSVRRLHFRHDEARRQSPVPPEHIQSGYIDFDTAHSYCPLAYEYHVKDPHVECTKRGVLTYESRSGIPILKTRTQEEPDIRLTRRPNEVIGSREIDTFKIEYNIKIPDEEFRLSHYGLPEPVGVTWKKPAPVYLWFGLAAVGCLLLAVSSRRAARYFRDKKAAKTAMNP